MHSLRRGNDGEYGLAGCMRIRMGAADDLHRFRRAAGGVGPYGGGTMEVHPKQEHLLSSIPYLISRTAMPTSPRGHDADLRTPVLFCGCQNRKLCKIHKKQNQFSTFKKETK